MIIPASLRAATLSPPLTQPSQQGGTESIFCITAREETKFKRARQLWVCAKGKGGVPGLAGHGSVSYGED